MSSKSGGGGSKGGPISLGVAFIIAAVLLTHSPWFSGEIDELTAWANGKGSSTVATAPAIPGKTTPPAGPAKTDAAPAPGTGTALALLESLPVKGRAPKTGYTRDQFGSAWTDDNTDSLGHNGCDTRNDVIKAQLTEVTMAEGSDCIVLSGTLNDPYTGKTINFLRGPKSSVVQVDHVIPLSLAWQTGAQGISASDRVNLANDPLNLVLVDGPTNGQKSDGDAATWLPPVKSYRCAYVARQVAVRVKYHLWVTAPEKDAIAGILATCPKQEVPTQ